MSKEIERPTPVKGPQSHVDLIGELCVRGVKTTQGVLSLRYHINVILWALDRARTLNFSSPKAFQTLSSGISL